jgi:hypothetical protein
MTWPKRSTSKVRHQSATVLSTKRPQRPDHAGIVDQEVDGPQRAFDVGDGTADGGFIRHVGDEGSRAVDVHRLPRHDRDPPAYRSQRLSKRPAEASPPACHHRYFHGSGLARR